jgi:hypothetical protein
MMFALEQVTEDGYMKDGVPCYSRAILEDGHAAIVIAATGKRLWVRFYRDAREQQCTSHEEARELVDALMTVVEADGCWEGHVQPPT